MNKPLSTRQRKIIDFVSSYIREMKFPPTVRDITAGCSISSTSVTDYNLNLLCEMGYITRAEEISRGIALGPRASMRDGEPFANVPVTGALSAGADPLASGATAPGASRARLGIVQTPAALLPNDRKVIALRVADDSLQHEMLAKGDTVLIDPDPDPSPDGHALVWRPAESRIALTEDPRHPNDLPRGRVLAVLRTF